MNETTAQFPTKYKIHNKPNDNNVQLKPLDTETLAYRKKLTAQSLTFMSLIACISAHARNAGYYICRILDERHTHPYLTYPANFNPFTVQCPPIKVQSVHGSPHEKDGLCLKKIEKYSNGS